ncbi:AraC family transcriptional regulator ligand-binding domain-containing protein, partial [Escherichia coli]|uniref:AraC family transcriptional regulator ligand-binding domain-containing protein n=1 Tax=Escherichia coli TaxID=562 RepID=UPI0035934DBE
MAAVVAVLGEDGISKQTALAGTGLREADLRADTTRVSYHQLETVFRNAIRLSNDPAIAFRAGQRMRVMAYGMYGYALLSSPSATEGIDLAAKYSRAFGAITD